MNSKHNYFELFTFKYRLSIYFCITSFLLLAAQNTWANAQRIAIVAPEKTGNSEIVAEKLGNSLSKSAKILDFSMSEAAFRAMNFELPFNLTIAESKTFGAAVGSNYFLLVKAQNIRRSAYRKPENYESYAAIFVVSSRSGRLVFWKLKTFEDETASKADKLLFEEIDKLSDEIIERLRTVSRDEFAERPTPGVLDLPSENSAEAKGLRPPLPYRRIKPEYTKIAYFYNVEATVDIEIEVGESGEILKTEIVRWAGFGLDESVRETVLKMQWRPADRNGKTLPMRVLLRYNFRKSSEK